MSNKEELHVFCNLFDYIGKSMPMWETTQLKNIFFLIIQKYIEAHDMSAISTYKIKNGIPKINVYYHWNCIKRERKSNRVSKKSVTITNREKTHHHLFLFS